MSEPPLPNYDYQVGGSLPIDAPSYVQRQADHDLYGYLKQGQFCYVLNSRQMGKSSLRVQVMQRLQQEGYACAAIDITSIGTATITPEQWYGGIINNLVNSFGLYDRFDLRTWWTEHNLLSPVQRLSLFIETVLLPQVAQPIVIFIDEIDSVLSLSFNLDDFFALIRDCFNRRADQPDYRRLSFTLLGVSTPSDLIQDRRRTPFNIGQAIELSGFQPSEAAPLLPGLAPRTQNPEAVLQAILYWTGGQPFLTQKLCNLVRQTQGEIPVGSEVQWVADLVQTQLIDQWENRDRPEHLRTIRDRILRSTSNRTARLLELYQQILQRGEVPAEASTDHMELRLTGLVVNHQAHLRVYNPIYQAIFNAQWVADAFAEIRPYAQQLQAWLQHNRKADADLLQGAQLAAALEWAESRSLSKQDYEYLVESQKLGLRQELDKMGAALEQTNQQLVERNNFLNQINEQLDAARQELARVRRRTRWATGIGLGLLGTLTLGSGWAVQEARAQRGAALVAVVQAEQARQEKLDAEKDLETIQTENDSLGVQQKELQVANQGLMGQNSKLDKNNEDLAQQNQQVKQEVNQAKAAQQKAQQQAVVAQQTLTQARNELSQAEESLTDAQQERLQAKNEAEAAQQTAVSLQARVNQQRRNLDDVFQISESISTFAQGNSDEAIVQLSQILEANPRNSLALISRGMILLKTNHLDQALQDFDQAIELDKENPTAYFGKGSALMQLDPPQNEAALEAFEEAITLNPNYHQAWTNRGLVLANMGKTIEAVESYTDALQIEPHYTFAMSDIKTILNRLIERAYGSSTQAIRLSFASIINITEGVESFEVYSNSQASSSNFVLDDEDAEIIARTSDLLLQINTEDPDAFHYLGFTSYIKKEYATALGQINTAISLHPEFPEAYVTRAYVRIAQGDYTDAIEDFDHAIEIFPYYTFAYSSRGFIKFLLRDYNSAISDSELSIKIDPTHAFAYYTLGVSYYEKSDYDSAIENLSLAISFDQRYRDAYKVRGQAYYYNDDTENALHDFNYAIALDPDYAHGYGARGYFYYLQGDLTKAIEDYNRSIELGLRDSNNYINRGNAYRAKGDLELAIDDYSHVIEGIDPNERIAYLMRGISYRIRGNIEAAINDFHKVVSIDPSHVYAYYNLGISYLLKGSYNSAIESLSLAINLNPSYEYAYRTRGEAYYYKGDFENAINDFDYAIELDPAYADGYSARGVFYYLRGDFERAIENYSRSIELGMTNLNNHMNRGNAYFSRGDFELAINDYSRAIEMDSQYGEAFIKRGEVFRIMQRYDAALADFNRAIEIGAGEAIAARDEVLLLLEQQQNH
jgi:tetratricopeptide (TPR) repeat protein